MRLHIRTTPNRTKVPFDHLPILVGIVHRWLGQNNSLHGRLSLYSFSWLKGGRKDGNGLEFSNGATFFINFYDEDYGRQVVKSILKDPKLQWGMIVSDVLIEENPTTIEKDYFVAASPILIKRNINSNIKHYLYSDIESNTLLEETLRSKMKIAGIEDETLKISFDLSYQNATTKLVRYRGIDNRANICPVRIYAQPKTKVFAWLVGLGNSTGIGFGSIN